MSKMRKRRAKKEHEQEHEHEQEQEREYENWCRASNSDLATKNTTGGASETTSDPGVDISNASRLNLANSQDEEEETKKGSVDNDRPSARNQFQPSWRLGTCQSARRKVR